MNDRKPIKRNESLQPLSRDHHEGLLFVWKIRQGLDNGTSIEKLRDYANWFWKNHIKAHFFQEEKLLLPVLPTGDPKAAKLISDHADIREIILTIGKEPERYDFFWLSNLLESHIRFEERELFPYVEQLLSTEDLLALGKKIEEAPATHSRGWTDCFWQLERKDLTNGSKPQRIK
jgi:hemerythrin-like domain-containing protein